MSRALFAAASLVLFGCKTPGANSDVDEVPQYEDKLKIEEVKSGDGAEAGIGSVLSVRYTGYLTNGTVFDSNADGAPLEFKLGAHQVIRGWDRGLFGMRVGGKRKLTIPSELGYGSQGSPPSIPPDSTLIFDVELLEVKSR